MIIEWWETDVYLLPSTPSDVQADYLSWLSWFWVSSQSTSCSYSSMCCMRKCVCKLCRLCKLCKVSPGFSWFLLVSPVLMVFLPGTVFPLSVTDVSTRFRSGPPMQPPKLTEGCDSPGSRRWLKNPKGDRCDVQFGGTSCMRCVPCWFGRKQITCSVYVHVENTAFQGQHPQIHSLSEVSPT